MQGPYVSCSLNSLKGVMWGFIYGITIRVTKGDTRSLDNGSCKLSWPFLEFHKVRIYKLPPLEIPLLYLV